MEGAVHARCFFNSLIVVLVATLVLSCSTGGNVSDTGTSSHADPVAPKITGQTQVESQMETDNSGHYLWSFVNVLVDPGEMKFEIVPLRQAETHWNTLRWLEQGPCTNCVALTNIEPSGTGTILVDVEITHPFSLTNLTGFDVHGIAMFAGTHWFPDSVRMTSDRTAGEGELVNADGFTSLYCPGTEGSGPNGLQGYMKGKFATAAYPNSTLNGYMRYISDDPANTRNAFYSGSAITRTFEIDMPNGPFILGYAVDASWVPPTSKPVVDPMTDFPPEANCTEPWKVDVTVDPIGQGLSNYGGSAVLSIDVYDWQGKSTVLSPRIECPELFDGSVTADWIADGTGYTTYEATISNPKLAGFGEYKCLIAAEDTENATAPVWLDLTGYQVILLEVVNFQNSLPVAQTTADPNPQKVFKDISFSDDGSYDPDGGLITKYEWDWNNDGTFDEEGVNVTHSWSVPGTYQVQSRVTDDESSSNILEFPLQIEIEEAGWACTWGSSFGNAVAVDPSGNVFVTGEFQGIVDLDPGPGVDEHTSNGNTDAYLSKFDPDGNLLWAVTWGGVGSEKGAGITVDFAGNVYLVGWFTDTVDFDPGPLMESRTSNGFTDTFVSMFDADGNFQWVDAWGGTLYDEGEDIASDGTSLIYVTGRFCSIVDFDPSGGIDEHIASDAADVFLVKLYNTGFYYWARTWGDLFDDSGYGVATDGYSNAYVTGLTDYAFLYKYTPDGNLTWSKDWGGGTFTIGRDVAVDGFGTAFVAGMFQGTGVDFDPGPGDDLRTSNGGGDMYLSSYDADGNYLWTNSWGGSGDDYAQSVSFNMYELVYVAGKYEDTVDFDPGAGSDFHVSNGNTDAFLSQFGMNGSFVWARTWGGTSYDDGRAVGTGQQLIKNAFVTGCFMGTVDFDPGSGVDEHTASGGLNTYLSKFLPDGSW